MAVQLRQPSSAMVQVPSLVWELRCHMPQGHETKTLNRSSVVTDSIEISFIYIKKSIYIKKEAYICVFKPLCV